jgi:hypothetical protein
MMHYQLHPYQLDSHKDDLLIAIPYLPACRVTASILLLTYTLAAPKLQQQQHQAATKLLVMLCIQLHHYARMAIRSASQDGLQFMVVSWAN